MQLHRQFLESIRVMLFSPALSFQTEGASSLCQTALINSVDGQFDFYSQSGQKLAHIYCTDFCLWGPPEEGHSIEDQKDSLVAWCTKPGRGARLIPPGIITGLQFIKTPAYVQGLQTYEYP